MKNSLLKKIVVGTAQFSKSYGVINKKTLSAIDLLKISKKNYLNIFDTSDNYGKNFYFVKKHYKTSKLIIKVSTQRKNKSIPLNVFKDKTLKIFKKIKLKSIYAILIHDFNLKKNNQNILHYKYLMDYCNNNHIKFGFSIYHLKEFLEIKRNYKFNILQIPLNVFNKEFLNTKFKNFVKKNKIEIHARSIFLQGLLVSNFNSIPNKFKKYKKYFMEWDKYCTKNNISKLHACINFVDNICFVTKIIIGFKGKRELKQITKYKRENIKSNFLSTKIPKNLANPNSWKNLK